MNFGHGIFAFYVCFVSVLAFQVYKSTTIDRTLVADNYYELDLAFQNTLEARQRGAGFDVSLSSDSIGQLWLQLPEAHVGLSATLDLQRPNGVNEDQSIDLGLIQGRQPITLQRSLQSGRYRARLRYERDKQAFEHNYILVIP